MTDTRDETRPALMLGGPTGRATLDAAEMAFGGARTSLAAVVARLQAKLDDKVSDKDLTPEVRELSAQLGSVSKTLAVCAEQEAKARDDYLERTGGGGIDMEAARAEVRSKLARLVPQGGA